jgi:hypothetical protein
MSQSSDDARIARRNFIVFTLTATLVLVLVVVATLLAL